MMASSSALLLDRLASHSAAGPSSHSVCPGRAPLRASRHAHRQRQPQRRAGRQGVSPQASATAGWRQGGGSSAVGGSGGGGGGGVAPEGPPATRCQALQAADYSFYQRLREGELTETYLWETRLAPLLSYLPPCEANAVREALSLAYDAHAGQARKSGEAFITHPVEVCRILAELRMDFESLVAGLLHDTVEDCGDLVGLDEIEFAFGPAVRRIVEGETKFSKLPTHHPEDRNSSGVAAAAASRAAVVGSNNGTAPAAGSFSSADAEGSTGGDSSISSSGEGCGCEEFPASTSTSPPAAAPAVDPKAQDPKAQDLQFLFLAMTEEVRIIVVKLADRLHNMRTMASMPPSKQRRIANETLQVFAPLARLLGLYTIKEELEELSFKYALPTQYDQMRRSMARLWQAQQPVVEAACAELQAKLTSDPYLQARVASVVVEAQRKSLYSTWRKLDAAGKAPKELGDIAQLRVVLTPLPPGAEGAVPPALDYGAERQLCYHVMGLVHSYWAPIPGGMKDYIATPKPNNYQSLHTTVVPTGLDLAASLASTNGSAAAVAAAALSGGNGTSDAAAGVLRRRGLVQLLFPIEVQIQTEAMNRLAENGIAVESWSCADTGSGGGAGSGFRRPATLPDAYANGAVNGTSSSNGSSWDGEAAAAQRPSNGSSSAGSNGNGSNRNGSNRNGSNGSALRSLPFNLGALMSSLAAAAGRNSSNGSSSSIGAIALQGEGVGSSSSEEEEEEDSDDPAAAGDEADLLLGRGGIDQQVLSRRINWLKSIREWQAEFVGMLTASEFVECVTDDLLGQSVFVFTPSGEVVRLPKGATAVDFAYHIHTEMGNTMVAAKVNGKLVNAAEHALQNAEVVEVVRYRGPVNATIIRRHQQWLDAAQTRSARHKIAKFLKQHAVLAASKGLAAPGDSGLLVQQQQQGAPADSDARQVTWLVMQCDDRPGLLAEVADVIARNRHNIKTYSGRSDLDAGIFMMEYELEGQPSSLGALCEELSCIESVGTWASGCFMPASSTSASPPTDRQAAAAAPAAPT